MKMDVEHFDTINDALEELELLSAFLMNHGEVKTFSLSIEQERLSVLGRMIYGYMEKIKNATDGIHENLKKGLKAEAA